MCCLCVVQYLGGDGVDVLNFAERARTVNARGEYVDHRYDVVLNMHARNSLLLVAHCNIKCV